MYNRYEQIRISIIYLVFLYKIYFGMLKSQKSVMKFQARQQTKIIVNSLFALRTPVFSTFNIEF